MLASLQVEAGLQLKVRLRDEPHLCLRMLLCQLQFPGLQVGRHLAKAFLPQPFPALILLGCVPSISGCDRCCLGGHCVLVHKIPFPRLAQPVWLGPALAEL